MRLRRFTCVDVVLAAACASPLLLTGTASADTATTISCSSSSGLTGENAPLVDFDGDGVADSVAGVPGANHGLGAIEVRDNRNSAATTLSPGDGMIPSTPAGAGLPFATADLNGDGCTDLVVGLPRQTVDGLANAGAMQVVYGSKTGFVAGPLITPDTTGVPGAAQAGENFGTALSANGSIVTVGVPGWSTSVAGTTLTHVGEALTLYINAGSDPAQYSLFSEGTLRMSHPVSGGRLGSTVGSNVAGAPNATGHGQPKAGCFVWLGLTYCGHHADDGLGASFATAPGNLLLVGAPNHELSVTTQSHGVSHAKVLKQAGVVEEFTRRTVNNQQAIVLQRVLTQASNGVPGAPTAGNRFGASVSRVSGQHDVLAIGIPGMSLPGAAHAGAVVVRDGGSSSSPWQLIDRKVTGVGGSAHRGDHFGAAVSVTPAGYPGAMGDFLLLVGAPGEAVGGHASAGRVQIFTNDGAKVALTGSQLMSESGGGQTGAQYGAAVG